MRGNQKKKGKGGSANTGNPAKASSGGGGTVHYLGGERTKEDFVIKRAGRGRGVGRRKDSERKDRERKEGLERSRPPPL